MLTTKLFFELSRGGKSVFSNGVKLGIMFKSSWLKYKTLHLLYILLFGYSRGIFFFFWCGHLFSWFWGACCDIGFLFGFGERT